MRDLTDKEYRLVIDWMNTIRQDEHLYYTMLLKSYQELFNPSTFQPYQMLNYFVLCGRELTEYHITTDVKALSFNAYIHGISGTMDNVFVGPRVPLNSEFKELVEISKIYDEINHPTKPKTSSLL